MTDPSQGYRAGQRTHTVALVAGFRSLAALIALIAWFSCELRRSPNPVCLTLIGATALGLTALLISGTVRARRRRRSTDHDRTLIVLLFAVLLLTGCGDPQQVIQSGTTGANAQVGDILLRNVYLDEPPNPSYPTGSDPTVLLVLINQGRQPDTLTRITTPVATTVEIHWDRGCDGTAETLPRLELPAHIDLTSPPNARSPGRADYFLRLIETTKPVLAGSAVPLTFTFTHAGSITMSAPVDAPGTSRSEAPRPCATP